MNKFLLLVPLPPADCSVTSVNKNTISITIRKDNDSDVSGYRVTYTDEDDTEETKDIPGEGPHNNIQITNLTPGTNYRFSTVAYTDGRISVPCNSTEKTCKSVFYLNSIDYNGIHNPCPGVFLA